MIRPAIKKWTLPRIKSWMSALESEATSHARVMCFAGCPSSEKFACIYTVLATRTDYQKALDPEKFQNISTELLNALKESLQLANKLRKKQAGVKDVNDVAICDLIASFEEAQTPEASEQFKKILSCVVANDYMYGKALDLLGFTDPLVQRLDAARLGAASLLVAHQCKAGHALSKSRAIVAQTPASVDDVVAIRAQIMERLTEAEILMNELLEGPIAENLVADPDPFKREMRDTFLKVGEAELRGLLDTRLKLVGTDPSSIVATLTAHLAAKGKELVPKLKAALQTAAEAKVPESFIAADHKDPTVLESMANESIRMYEEVARTTAEPRLKVFFDGPEPTRFTPETIQRDVHDLLQRECWGETEWKVHALTQVISNPAVAARLKERLSNTEHDIKIAEDALSVFVARIAELRIAKEMNRRFADIKREFGELREDQARSEALARCREAEQRKAEELLRELAEVHARIERSCAMERESRRQRLTWRPQQSAESADH